MFAADLNNNNSLISIDLPIIQGKILEYGSASRDEKGNESHSMVKDNLELPSLMSLEDSPVKEELFRKMGESKMNKDEIITQINRNKLVKFVRPIIPV